jgi:membrane-associated phospholipid phosphatase
MPSQSNPEAHSPGTEEPSAQLWRPAKRRVASAQQTASRREVAFLRTSEWLVATYFVLTASRAAMRGAYAVAALDASVPLVFLSIEIIERRVRRAWIAIARDWIPLALLLPAYWNIDVVAAPRSSYAFEFYWIAVDRLLLNNWHVRAIIESLGPLLPLLLEFSYLILYAMPPLLLGAVYRFSGRHRADQFLFTLLAGALLAYSLLPLFPTESPRILFQRQDLPTVMTVFRRANIWVLNACDIRTSVFPSGHVTVAFSCAFAAISAIPTKPWIGRSLLLFATLVAINTLYGRYHFAIDALAGFGIAVLGYLISRRVHREPVGTTRHPA